MAKAKNRKTQKKKTGLNEEILIYLYALTAIAVAVIGCLEIGFVGALLGGLVKYLIGRLYGVFYGAVILVSLMAMFRRSWKELPLQYLLSLSLFLLSWLILASLPKEESRSAGELLSS